MKPEKRQLVQNAAPARDFQPGRRLSKSQADRRTAILSATIDLLATHEPGQIHMRDIADRSAVALATLYRYFASKELLFAHAIVAWGEAFVTKTQRRTADNLSDAERMQQTLRRTMKAYERWPNFYKLIAALEITDDDEAREVFKVFSDRYRQSLGSLLERTHPDDGEVVAQVLVATLGAALRKWSVGEWRAGQVYDHVHKAVELIFGELRKI